MEGGAAPLAAVTCNTDRVLVKSKRSRSKYEKKTRGCAVVPKVKKNIKFELSFWKENSHIGGNQKQYSVLLVCGLTERMSPNENPEKKCFFLLYI